MQKLKPSLNPGAASQGGWWTEADEILREELVRFCPAYHHRDCPSAPTAAATPSPWRRAAPALKRQCEAADAALARLRAAARGDRRPGAAAAHAEAVAEAARAAAAAVAAVRASLEAQAPAADARRAGGLAVSWTSSLGPGDAIGVVADYDARKPMFAVAEATLPTLVACALDEGAGLRGGARAGERRAARALAEDAAAGLSARPGRSRTRRVSGGPRRSRRRGVVAARAKGAGRGLAAVATARGDACLAAADPLVVRKGRA